MEYYVGQTENNLDMHFDDERPPIYNAEDYAAHLRKYSRWTEHTLNTKKTWATFNQVDWNSALQQCQ